MTTPGRPPLPPSFFVAVLAGTVGAILLAVAVAIGAGMLEPPAPALAEPISLGVMGFVGAVLMALEARAVLTLARARRGPPES